MKDIGSFDAKSGRVEIEESAMVPGGAFINADCVQMSPADVARLIAALQPYSAAPSATPLAAIEVGQTYRLLPGATTMDGGGVYFAEGTTKVRVVYGPDADGDVSVEALDGDDVGGTQYVDPKYLAALTDIAADGDTGPKHLDPARVAAVEYVADTFEDFTAAELLDVARFLLLED